MIVVDTSAVIALLFREPVGPRIAETLALNPDAMLPASAYVEASMVCGGRNGLVGLHELDLLVSQLGLAIVPFTAQHARAAQTAFTTYGKGRHPAALNFGDCMSYAVASVAGRGLLFAGGDFALTDVGVA